MKFSSRSRQAPGDLPGAVGTIRADRRTAALLDRLHPGDIAVIDHVDLDRTTAEALVDRQVGAVVNASPFISGRYPNLGPEILAAAGVPMLDAVGADVFGKVRDGGRGRVHEGSLYVKDQRVADGRSLGEPEIAALMDDARSGLAAQLQAFTANAVEFLRRQQGLLLHGEGVPELETRFHGRPVVVVVQGFSSRADLRRLRRYVKEQRPVLVGVDAGADALLAAGFDPQLLVIGQQGFDHPGATTTPVSDKALRAAHEVLLHSDESGRVIGAERLERLGIRPQELPAAGTTVDVAMLVADASGASLIVTVGSHATLDELLDRSQTGQASTFLTRLRIGAKLVDARGVPELYAGRVRIWQAFAVLLAGLVAVGAAVATTPVGQDWYHQLQDKVHDVRGTHDSQGTP